MAAGDYKKNIANLIKEVDPSCDENSIILNMELQQKSFSLSDIKGMYEYGIESLDFRNAMDVLHVCARGYSVLIRLAIGIDEYVKWAEQQDIANKYILKRIVGITDKALEAEFADSYAKQMISSLHSNKSRAMLTPTDDVAVLSLFGHNVAVTEKMLTYIDVKRKLCSISENVEEQFEAGYNAAIDDYMSLQNNLMMVIQDATELALDEIKKYLEKKGCESQSIEKNYLDMVAKNNPYILMLGEVEQIFNQYQSQSVKNEVNRLRRESTHFVGGGFGIRGFIAGTVTAEAANLAADAFNGVVNGISEGMNNSRVRSQLNKLANDPKRRQRYRESIRKNVLALEGNICRVLCPAESMEIIIEETFLLESSQEVTLPHMLLKASSEALKEVLYFSMLLQPFAGYMKAAFDALGDNDNELEILAGCTGQTDFLKYKYKKQGKKEEEIPRFPLIEELISNKEVMAFLNEFVKIEKIIQGGEWSYETADGMIENLHTAYMQAHANVPPEYVQGFNCCLQLQENKMIQMLQNSACVAEGCSYANYFEACLMKGYAERFEDIYTKYTLDFVRNFTDGDFDSRKQHLLQLKDEAPFLKNYFALSSKKFRDYVEELAEKINFIKYMSKNPAIREGKWDYEFHFLFQERAKEVLKVAAQRLSSSYIDYKTDELIRKDFMMRVVSEYDYCITNKDIRETIGEPCGQYVLFYQRYMDSESRKMKSLVLTDQFLYLGEKKIALEQLTTISDYRDVKRRIVILSLGQKRVQCSDLYDINSLLPQFYNTIRHAMPDLEHNCSHNRHYKCGECLKCGSREIHIGVFKENCKACGSKEIGHFYEYGFFRYKYELFNETAEFELKKEGDALYIKWCRELIGEAGRNQTENQKEFIYCPKCGKQSLSGKKFCSNCGNPLVLNDAKRKTNTLDQSIVCSNCGNLIKPGKKFCSTCGMKI